MKLYVIISLGNEKLEDLGTENHQIYAVQQLSNKLSINPYLGWAFSGLFIDGGDKMPPS